jgi:Flp pilus assembly protein TadG
LSTITTARLAALRGEERGTVAIIFAFCLFALVMVLGLALDIGRAVHTKFKLASAADGAALAAAKSMHDRNMTLAEIKALARTYFEANVGKSGPDFGSISDFDVAVDREKGVVTVDAAAVVPTTFARLGGLQSMTTPATAVAAFDPKDIEVGLSLDVTGSMCNPCSKIEDLQAAARDMVDILLPANKSTSNKVRIALAPFAAGVNAGAYATPATGKSAPDTCTFERDGSEQATDSGPGAGSYLKVAGDAGVVANRNNCPSGAQVTALSDDAGMLKRAIDKLRAGGSTAGHLGTAWAWYLVSPNWSSVWPSASRPVAYGDKKTIKAVVLMTDGVYNTFGGACDRNCSNVSQQATKSQDVARRLCSNMKSQNVKVYSIGFKLDDRLAENILRECASTALTFYRAENGEQLRQAFRQIAEDLMRLRLAQ